MVEFLKNHSVTSLIGPDQAGHSPPSQPGPQRPFFAWQAQPIVPNRPLMVVFASVVPRLARPASPVHSSPPCTDASTVVTLWPCHPASCKDTPVPRRSSPPRRRPSLLLPCQPSSPVPSSPSAPASPQPLSPQRRPHPTTAASPQPSSPRPLLSRAVVSCRARAVPSTA